MTINLPPRRTLPGDVKERMRPNLTEVRARRNHTPLAVAAGVALLIAGGVTVTQSITDNTLDPGRGRVVTPSSQDLSRCRAALGDPGWSSTEMVVFGLRKVLVGADGRFCELTRSSASVVSRKASPVQLEAGSVHHRSDRIIAGVPSLGALTVKARESTGTYSRGSTDAVVTPDFFVAYTPNPVGFTELVFDNRTVALPPITAQPQATTTSNFESGDDNPWTEVNVLARCSDNAFTQGTAADDLQGWEPLLQSGLEHRDGLLIAHQNHRRWAICPFSAAGANALGQFHEASAAPADHVFLGGIFTGNGYILAARTKQTATTVEVSDSHGSVVADVVNGFYLARLRQHGGSGSSLIGPSDLRITARNADKEVVYEGGIG